MTTMTATIGAPLYRLDVFATADVGLMTTFVFANPLTVSALLMTTCSS